MAITTVPSDIRAILALQIPGFNNPDAVPVSDGPPMLSLMSEVTGGRCQAVSSMKALFSVIEGIIARLQPGVVVSFETVLPLPASAPVIAPSLHKLLFVRTTQPGSWPIPEAFLPDQTLTSLVRIYACLHTHCVLSTRVMP